MLFTLDLHGHYFTLYFEGRLVEERGGLAFDDSAISGRRYYAGKARVTLGRHDQSRVFDFATLSRLGPHHLNDDLFLAPEAFDTLHGHARSAVCQLIQDCSRSVIDRLAQETLALIEGWEIRERRIKRGKWKHILMPPTIVFGYLETSLIEEVLFGSADLDLVEI